MTPGLAFFALLFASAIFAFCSVAGLAVGTLTAQRRFNKRLRQAKARYTQHPEHMTDCPIYKEFVITEILLELAEDELRSIKATESAP